MPAEIPGEGPEIPEEGQEEGGLAQPLAIKNVGGRPRRNDVEAMKLAISSTVPPERIHEMLERAIGYADYHKSAKGMLSILEFVFDRLAGTPIPIEQSGPDVLDAFMDRLRAHYNK